jgi:hypothetical protein
MTSTLVILRLRSAAPSALPAQQVHWWGESCTHSDRYPRQSSSWTYIDTSTVQDTKSARDHWVISRLIATSWKKSFLSPGTAISLRPTLRPGPCRRPLEICARSDGGRCECCANHQDSTRSRGPVRIILWQALVPSTRLRVAGVRPALAYWPLSKKSPTEDADDAHSTIILRCRAAAPCTARCAGLFSESSFRLGATLGCAPGS